MLIHEANDYSLQLLIATRLRPEHRYEFAETSSHWLTGDVHVTMRRVGNQSGLPDDAECFRLTFDGPDFQVLARAVFLNGGELFQPVGTHTRIVAIEPDTEKAEVGFNQWLQKL